MAYFHGVSTNRCDIHITHTPPHTEGTWKQHNGRVWGSWRLRGDELLRKSLRSEKDGRGRVVKDTHTHTPQAQVRTASLPGAGAIAASNWTGRGPPGPGGLEGDRKAHTTGTELKFALFRSNPEDKGTSYLGHFFGLLPSSSRPPALFPISPSVGSTAPRTSPVRLAANPFPFVVHRSS